MKLTPGQLSQLAYEAVISGASNAAEITAQAARAYADSKASDGER